MYVQRGQFGARARYQSVDLASRIEGATPHRLVQIMFDELIKAIDALTVAVRRRDLSQRAQRQSRALAILNGLETSLDFEKGGEIATGLAGIYRQARRTLVQACRDDDAEAIAKAGQQLGEIASAWSAIGERGR
ncbi:flagellar export chaperone FliS [Sphingosinicella ginsenosidimutans]|jgi:flagellar protein FliS|uniref:Flagellar secretion chaperone FliS n=1 Tax=Allosphingosinicella ginsenosidimutans TaxID=1176539 RepID=A0A5C6TTN2_9SPHN|nr:flagellar export chaperone FliS [Sphingosinicella ginsenosidimutans]TXC63783.1 flagellar export chaperone FliS [Sphingosinicella ginsenosidimutans]